MESREILIANTRTQKSYKVNSTATTLGELKEELDNYTNLMVKQGSNWVANTEPVCFEGLSFTEGISRVELLDNDSPLPETVNYKGQPTRNLVMLLSDTKRKIKLGAMSRKEVYEAIKTANLMDAVKEHFGRNYTQVPTADLAAFIDEHSDNNDPDYDDEEDETDDLPPVGSDFDIDTVRTTVKDAVCVLVQALYENGFLESIALSEIKEFIGTLYNNSLGKEKMKVGDIEISDADINDMLTDI